MPGNTGGDPKITSRGNENTVLFIDTKTSVLLQTAKIFVSRADDPNHRIQARLIFDTGSQRSYVSTRLRNALQLPTINQETLMIKTFESETGQIQSRDLVQLCVQGMTSETYLYVSAYAVPIKDAYLGWSTLPPFVSTRLNTNPVYVHKSLHFFATDILIQPQ